MDLNFISEKQINKASSPFSLLIAVCIIGCCLVYMPIREKIKAVEGEITAVHGLLTVNEEKARQTQNHDLQETIRKERQFFMAALKADQTLYSEIMQHLLSWLPEDVALTSIIYEMTGTLSIFGNSANLSSIAHLLQLIELDESFGILTISPLTNQGTGFSFSLQIGYYKEMH